MALIYWTKDLQTGIERVDEQHKKLVDLINELFEANRNKDRSLVAHVLDELVDYTVFHFKDEEEMMAEAGYRFLEEHAKVHQRFVDKVAGFQSRFKKGEDIADELLAILEDWLIRHIKLNDRGYVNTVKAHQEETA